MTQFSRFIAISFAVLMLAGCQEEVYQGLAERDANEMVAVLYDGGITASRGKIEREGYSVRVERSDFAKAVKLLSAAGLPREQYKSMDDVFPGGKLLLSPAEQRARFAFALSQELTRSVGQIAGVSWNRVHVALAVQNLRGAVVTPATASVIVRVTDAADIAEVSIQARQIIASAVEGLANENVKVVVSMSQQSNTAPLSPSCLKDDPRCRDVMVGFAR